MFWRASFSIVYMPILPDASFTQKLQEGGRIPEVHVVISWWREEMSAWCQRIRHSFRACPIHFHRYRHRPTSENSNTYKPEVETVPQTRSTNNLATETDTDAISVAIPTFWCKFFNGVYADLTRRFLHPEIQRWRTYTGSSYNFVTKNNITVILAAWVIFYLCVATEIASISVSVDNLLVLPVLGTVSTSGLHLIVLSPIGQCWCWCRWIGRALKHCRSRWDRLDIIFIRNVIPTSGIRLPSWNFWLNEADIYISENPVSKHNYSHWDRVDICLRC